MRTLRKLHLYLGCLFAPGLIFFAASGTWQLYRWHDPTKDGSYRPPRPLQTLSAVHMNSHLPGKRVTEFTPLRIFWVLTAAGLVATSVLGIVMAFRVSPRALTPTLFLAAGIVLPVVFLYFYG